MSGPGKSLQIQGLPLAFRFCSNLGMVSSKFSVLSVSF